MSNVIEKLNNQINIDKEILSVLPINNKKNLKAYKDKAEEIKREYVQYLGDLTAEIKRRTLKISAIKENPQIEELSAELEDMDKIKWLDTKKTPFEKMELDENLYVLKRFYKNNLELVNNSILNCIEKFRKTGLKLSLDDFNYSIYTKEYMKVFFEEMRKGDINSIDVKNTFEQIYWKCPDIILHIELNFRSLYLKYEKQITNYFEKSGKRLLKRNDLNYSEILEKYRTIKSKLKNLKDKDTYLILQKFLNGEDNIKEYEETNIQKNYKKLISILPEDLDKEQLKEFDDNIEKLSNSLYEYKNYLKYKFIYDEVISIYNDKQKYNKIYNDELKQIKKAQVKLFKANRKIEKYEKHKGIISKLLNKNQNKLEKINVDVNEQVLKLKELYRNLENNKVKNIICTELRDTSTIYDAIALASAFYNFLVDTLIKQYEDISQEDIITTIDEFRNFIQYPNISTINNMKITDNRDIVLVIKDKYNLCNINIEKGDFSEDNIHGIIATTNCLCNYKYIVNSKIDVEDIKFMLEANKILEKNRQ